MRTRDYLAKAQKRIDRIYNEAMASGLRSLTRALQSLEREKLEIEIRRQRAKPKGRPAPPQPAPEEP